MRSVVVRVCCSIRSEIINELIRMRSVDPSAWVPRQGKKSSPERSLFLCLSFQFQGTRRRRRRRRSPPPTMSGPLSAHSTRGRFVLELRGVEHQVSF